MELKCEVSWKTTQRRYRHRNGKERENENGKKI